ncbi:MAG: type II toxin-antitoxin system VapB family antitoxin [Geminicoccaceae bacterium]
MALNIKSTETDRLARELAALTGESITEAVTRALEERLAQKRRQLGRKERLARAAALDELFDRLAGYPVLDGRPADVLLGYDEDGTFAA